MYKHNDTNYLQAQCFKIIFKRVYGNKLNCMVVTNTKEGFFQKKVSLSQ